MSKRIVLLTQDGLEHRYVANALCAAVPVAAILVASPARRSLYRRLRRYSPRALLSRAVRKVYLRSIGDERDRAEALGRILGAEWTGSFPSACQWEAVQGVNGARCVECLKAIGPDLIVVYGTSIVRNHVLATASDLAINMHTGMSPEYRGNSCAFWPIANGEPGYVGATTHECTSALDGGRIFARRAAHLQPDDGVHEVFARAVLTGAQLLTETVQAYLDGRLDSADQDLSIGREYRASDRTVAVEMRTRRDIRNGLIERHCQIQAHNPTGLSCGAGAESSPVHRERIGAR